MSSNNVTFFCLFMLTCFFDPCILLISFQRHLYQSVMPLSLSLSLSLSFHFDNCLLRLCLHLTQILILKDADKQLHTFLTKWANAGIFFIYFSFFTNKKLWTSAGFKHGSLE